jgi:hypothetical protein
MNSRASQLLLALGVAMALNASAQSPLSAPMGDGRFAGIHRGLTQEEVRTLAGAPSAVTDASDSGLSHWIYNYVDSWGMRSVYDVTFDTSGHVARTSSMRVGF